MVSIHTCGFDFLVHEFIAKKSVPLGWERDQVWKEPTLMASIMSMFKILIGEIQVEDSLDRYEVNIGGISACTPG